MAPTEIHYRGAMTFSGPAICSQLALLCQIAHHPFACNLSSEGVFPFDGGGQSLIRVYLRRVAEGAQKLLEAVQKVIRTILERL